MTEIDLQAVERYQQILASDPASPVFAPLAECYRKMGLLKEALDVAKSGIQNHPKHPGGRVALSKVLGDMGEFKLAIDEADRAISLSPDNVLAHHLKAEYLLRLQRPKDALKDYKILLFIMPENQRAQVAVKKLESLTAEEFDEEVFAMKPLKDVVAAWSADLNIEDDDNKETLKRSRVLDRIVSLADAYLARQQNDKALEVLNEGESLLGNDTEIVKRLKIIHQRGLDSIAIPKSEAELKPIDRKANNRNEHRIEILRDLHNKFNAKRFTSGTPSGS
jgi:tetratricopeptide (TPR) repeat protein